MHAAYCTQVISFTSFVMALPEETLKLSPIASDQRSSAPCFSDANYRREDHAQTVAGRAKHQVDLMIVG
ncbi:hypothetical protein B0T13DRAFT_467893 [Neurospora crassa]|nr:hypothetical protein B0T13DRAFT_467893 [Neurospora crassa]